MTSEISWVIVGSGILVIKLVEITGGNSSAFFNFETVCILNGLKIVEPTQTLRWFFFFLFFYLRPLLIKYFLCTSYFENIWLSQHLLKGLNYYNQSSSM
jgi:hypothetical protein